ncbi:hypothetical protein KEH51_10325 [[Brevibacterium] frigoritolerans]|uniref:Uncharacterized protein n=1 Tax=Peribacillus frigoritolerans TaxID=450367 RepID=A0A941J2I7_9BACI|nr:hypothetical protein [Peribacillus frigoritolerans]
MEIHREAQSSLRELVNDFGEAVHIGILEGTETVYLDKNGKLTSSPFIFPHTERIIQHIALDAEK